MSAGEAPRMNPRRSIALFLAAAVPSACASSALEIHSSTDIDGGQQLSFDDGSAPLVEGDAMTTVSLLAIVRDFRFYDAGDKTTNPDFENGPYTDQNGNPNK